MLNSVATLRATPSTCTSPLAFLADRLYLMVFSAGSEELMLGHYLTVPTAIELGS